MSYLASNRSPQSLSIPCWILHRLQAACVLREYKILSIPCWILQKVYQHGVAGGERDFQFLVGFCVVVVRGRRGIFQFLVGFCKKPKPDLRIPSDNFQFLVGFCVCEKGLGLGAENTSFNSLLDFATIYVGVRLGGGSFFQFLVGFCT